MDDIDTVFNKAVGFMVEKKYKEARKLFREVTLRDPSAATAWHNLGIMEGIFKNYTTAIDALQHAVAINPGYEDAWYILGMAYAKAGNLDQAFEVFRKILASNPKHIDAWNSLGMALVDDGNYKDAIDAYESCLRSNPDALEVQLVLPEICKTREDEIARLTKARSLFLAARNDIKKRHLVSVAKQLEGDIEKGPFRHDADIRGLNQEQLALIRDRLRELT